MTGDNNAPYQPEELLAIMEAKQHGDLSRVAHRIHRNFTVCVSKRQECRDGALVRRQMPTVFLPDDGTPFAALMTRIKRDHRR